MVVIKGGDWIYAAESEGGTMAGFLTVFGEITPLHSFDRTKRDRIGSFNPDRKAKDL